MRSYDAVFLDAQGTVLKPVPSVASIYEQVCLRFGHVATHDEIAAAARDLWAEYRASLDIETASFETSDEITRRWWADYNTKLFQRLGMGKGLHEFLDAIWEVFADPANWALFPDVTQTLVELRSRGYTLGIVSNWDSRLMGILQALRLTELVEFVVASAPAGIEKPDPRIFEIALSKAGTTADRAIHVGDDYLADVVGARRAGVEPVLIDRDGEVDAAEPVTTIRSLTELLSIL